MDTNPNPQAYKVNVSAQINTNAQPENIFYDMELYKTDWVGNKIHALKPTGKQPLQAGNKTQEHKSLPLTDPLETCYILSINIYRKVGVDFVKMTTTAQTAIISLKGFLKGGEAWGASRTFEYYETPQSTQPSKNGEINTYVLNISSKPRVFEAKEHPLGDPLDPFTKQKIEEELKIRMTRPAISYQQMLKLPFFDKKRRTLSYPNQDRSSLCGPAAFFYCLLKDRSDIYQQVIKELWEVGKTKIGSLKIEPSSDCKKPRSYFLEFNIASKKHIVVKVPAIDWITLASLRDGENSFFDYQSPDNEFSGITLDGGLKKWFKAIGLNYIYSTSFNYLTTYVVGSNLNIREVCRLNNYINGSNHVATLIGTGLIEASGGRNKSHWVVWEDKVRLLDNSEITVNTPLSAQVKLKVFSWGTIMDSTVNFTLKDVLECLYGGVVFPKIP